MMNRLPVVLALVLAACGSTSPPPDQPLERVEEPKLDTGPRDAGPGAPRREGEVARADLNRVLDAGPGAFLARGEVKARVVKGQFHGWEVIRSPYAEIDLRQGDVILSVNGSVLEHPVDLERLWNDLRAANAIAIDIERGGQRVALRFAIVPPQ